MILTDTRKNQHRAIFAFLLFLAVIPSVAPFFVSALEQSPAVKKILTASFALKEQKAVIASLVSGASGQTVPSDKKMILSALADYEERLGLFGSAARHYHEAAFAEPSARDDAFLLDSARCSLVANETETADGLVRAVLLTSFEEKILIRSRVYAAWILLSSGKTTEALSLFRSYSQNPSFSEFAPALLFTLWWTDNDESSRSLLLSSYPLTPEAALVRGESSLSPSPFWYLMGRKESLVEAFANDGNKSLAPALTDSSPVKVSETKINGTDKPGDTSINEGIKVWQQVGFFKNKEYADELVALLKKKGFQAVVRNEKRPSGIVYLSVLVPEDSKRSIGSKLKDAGFESFLLMDE